MPRPRPPSRIDPLSFPVFGMDWYADPGTGVSVYAYGGGGGSAKTGVNNAVVITENDEFPRQVSTGTGVCIALKIYKNPVSNQVWMIVGLGNQIHRYALPGGEEAEGKLDAEEGINALAVNAMADRLAAGCDSGVIKVYSMTDDAFANPTPLYILEGHTKAVCAMAFSMHGSRLLSSSKDGTACLWKEDKQLTQLKCSVEDPTAPPPKRPPQILVRGCAFGDLQGKVLLTVASARRGKAFLAQWKEKGGDKWECVERTACSGNPISAMSLSGDGGLLALGSVDGSIILWGVHEWKSLKVFSEVHELPVTCIAARPYPVQLRGEEDGVQIHARSASADSQFGCLTLQKRAPRKQQPPSDGGFVRFLVRVRTLVYIGLVLWVLSPIAQEARAKCEEPFKRNGAGALSECLLNEVLIAPAWKPGVQVPPY